MFFRSAFSPGRIPDYLFNPRPPTTQIVPRPPPPRVATAQQPTPVSFINTRRRQPAGLSLLNMFATPPSSAIPFGNLIGPNPAVLSGVGSGVGGGSRVFE